MLKTACIHGMQFKGLGVLNKRFATQKVFLYRRKHCLRKLCSLCGAVFCFVCKFRRTATILNKNRIVLPRKVGRKEKDFVLYRPSLGGRINLLYCFFWGIAAVMWMRYGYPLVLKLMKKVRSHIRPWMTAALAVFMAVNMLTSALALARYDARTSGDAPNGQLEVFLDEHFDNARMDHIYPNAKKVTKAE